MKLTSKTNILAMLATLFVGIFIGSMLTWKCGKKDETISTIEYFTLHEIIHDTTIVTDTIVLSTTDTLIITQDTPIGTIPVRTPTFHDSIPLKVYGKTIHIPFELGITYRGILYNYSLATHPKDFEVSPKRKVVDLYGTVAVGVNWGLEICGEVEVGMMFWDKVAVFGKVYADEWPVQVKPYAGLKYVIF